MFLSRLRPIFIVALGVMLGLVLSPSLSGCASGGGGVHRFVGSIMGPEYGLPDDARARLAEFRGNYDRYAADDGSRDDQYAHFIEAFRYIRASYVQEVPDARLLAGADKGLGTLEGTPGGFAPDAVIEAALNTMLHDLDPHSAYLSPREAHELTVSTRGEFGGLGIEVAVDEAGVRVIAPIEDTPAEKSGIRAGDILTHLDGEAMAGWPLTRSVMRMRGQPGSAVTLTVAREGAASFDVRLVRAVIQVRAVRWERIGDVGVIRVVRLNEKAESGVGEAMAALTDRGRDPLRALVLDLRNNPGGLLDQAVAVSSAFLDRGTVVEIKGRRSGDSRSYAASSGDLAAGLPMVVLVNAGSASASEIVAGALQDHGRAVVLGARTFGKGSVQTILPLSNSGALKLTTSLYYAPSGRSIQAHGIDPDIVLAEETPAVEAVEGEDGAETRPKIRREADVPGALGVTADALAEVRRPVVDAAGCPVMGRDPERPDRGLGCALKLLDAGSPDRFLAELAPFRRM